jgi:hypothetical protein
VATRRWLGLGAAAVAGIAAILVPVAVGASLRGRGTPAVQFRATGNRGLKVTGRSPTLWVSDNGHVISVMVPLASLRTGVGLRDTHMRNKFLQTAQYPDIRLDVPWAVVRRPPPGGTVTAEASGLLHLHGRTRPLPFRYTARDEGTVTTVVGTFRLDIRDYGIQQPHFLGIRLTPLVDAEARFQVSGVR